MQTLSGFSSTINSESTVYASPGPSTVPHCMKYPVTFISQSFLVSNYLCVKWIIITTV